jgi:Putative transposase
MVRACEAVGYAPRELNYDPTTMRSMVGGPVGAFALQHPEIQPHWLVRIGSTDGCGRTGAAPWGGSAMTHHPHIHLIVPGGGISLDGTRWVRCRPGFLLPVRVLSRLFRRLFLTGLDDACAAGRLAFFGDLDGLRRRKVFATHLAPLSRKNWFVYAKPPFQGPEAVLAYLARYTHRVAISNSRLVAFDERGVTFRYKDYRRNGQARYRMMTLAPDEFIRCFLLHVLPKGFHRIRHYGLLATATCKTNYAGQGTDRRTRSVIYPPAENDDADQSAGAAADHRPQCPCCGGRMIIVEIFARGATPRGPPPGGARVRTATS